ncbi:MAG: hypothetical protein GY730_07460 [bacterium]|nr:hypothetical protein [bacterium]
MKKIAFIFTLTALTQIFLFGDYKYINKDGYQNLEWGNTLRFAKKKLPNIRIIKRNKAGISICLCNNYFKDGGDLFLFFYRDKLYQLKFYLIGKAFAITRSDLKVIYPDANFKDLQKNSVLLDGAFVMCLGNTTALLSGNEYLSILNIFDNKFHMYYKKRKINQKFRQEKESSTKSNSLIKNMKYKIISESPDIIFNNDRLRIELSERVDKQSLKKIAMKLRSTRKQYDRLWIWYFIKGLDPNQWAWAISHFKPEGLLLEINGAPLSKINELKKTTVKQNYDQILGRWLDETPIAESLHIIYVAHGKIYVQANFIDGSSCVNELIKTEENGKTRYDNVGIFHGEYFIIEKNGNLGLYDKDGKFREDKKL